MTLWDISPPIAPGMPVWLGDRPYAEISSWAIRPTHPRSHADAPPHYDVAGPVGTHDRTRYLGPVRAELRRPAP